MTRTRSVELAQQVGEIPIARLMGGGFECTAERRHDAGVRRRDLHLDNPAIHATHIRCREVFAFKVHWEGKRLKARGGFVEVAFGQ
jgi:hypothetical protein